MKAEASGQAQTLARAAQVSAGLACVQWHFRCCVRKSCIACANAAPSLPHRTAGDRCAMLAHATGAQLQRGGRLARPAAAEGHGQHGPKAGRCQELQCTSIFS